LLELLVARAEEPFEPQLGGAHVVHEDVDALVLAERTLDELRWTVGHGEIDGDGRHALEALQAIDCSRAGHDARAFRDEGARDREADALARSGDNRNSSIEFEIHDSLGAKYIRRRRASYTQHRVGARSGPSRELDQRGHAVEIGSGTGQHVAEFAGRFPEITWWPSDLNDNHLTSVEAWRVHSQLPNIRSPRRIDVSDPAWGDATREDGGPAELLVERLAERAGLSLVEIAEMPANNLTLVFRRAEP
jgi:hypothetical protein